MEYVDAPLAARLGEELTRMAGPGVGCCVLPVHDGHRLLAGEQDIVANAIDSRRREFAAGRACARAALAKVACPPLPILRGAFYEPIWPRGFAGSISHDNRFAAAIAYRSQHANRLGIDLIDRANLTIFAEIASTFLTASESRNLAGSDPSYVARVFSAKEAAIKIVSIRRRMFVDFHAIASSSTPDGMLLHVAGASPILATFTEFDGVLVTLAAEQDTAPTGMARRSAAATGVRRTAAPALLPISLTASGSNPAATRPYLTGRDDAVDR